jgi:hypothetical protein
MQKYDRVLVNGRVNPTPALTARPTNDSGLAHGTTFYNKNFTALGWWYGNVTYNITTAAVWLAGGSNSALTVQTRLCPEEGCNTLGSGPADFRWGSKQQWRFYMLHVYGVALCPGPGLLVMFISVQVPATLRSPCPPAIRCLALTATGTGHCTGRRMPPGSTAPVASLLRGRM